jgi:hypothetical protein
VTGPVTVERDRLAREVRDARALEARARTEAHQAARAADRARGELEAFWADLVGEPDHERLRELRAAVTEAEARLQRDPQVGGGPDRVVDVEAEGRLRAATRAREAAEQALADLEATRYDDLVGEATPDAVAVTVRLGRALREADRALEAWHQVDGALLGLGERTGRGDRSLHPVDPVPQEARQALAVAAGEVAGNVRGWLPVPAPVAAALPADALAAAAEDGGARA